jgi:hypothetical protein
MSKITQKEAVFAAVSTVLSNAGVTVADGESAKQHMTKELRAQVNQILFAGFRANEVELDGEKTDAELKQYVSGLQSNWLNKDKRLNGNVTYVAKNPGSRTGISDSQVKALRGLLSQTEDAAERMEIQGYLDARLAEIGVKKAKKAEIDFSALPAELAAKYTTTTEETSEEA